MKDGYIRSLDDRTTRYIKALRGSAYDAVTVRQLLTMTSGVKWNLLSHATRAHVSTGPGSGYGYQWWIRDDGSFEGRGICGQTLHIDRARRLVIVLNSATEQPTGRAQGQTRQAFIAAVQAEVDAEKRLTGSSPRSVH